MQQKDVIYIDVEDDITAIIGKVKDAKQKIVALVPPKRTGVLQSAVNLKLLARAANNANKRLVLITGNAALGGLAASAEIPVAKSLNSRPELVKPSTASINDADVEDLIDGDKLDVGDHIDLKPKDDTDDMSDTIEGIDIDGESTPLPPKSAPTRKETAKRGMKVPDFGSFRKKAAIGAGVGVLLVLFFYWANWVAPHATIVVSAKTTGQSLSYPVTLGTDLENDVDQKHIKSIEQTFKDTQSVDFDATGSKDLGDKATGTVKFSTTYIPLLGTTIPAGTKLTSSDGLVFITSESVTFTISNFNGAPVGITATSGGTQYNDVSGSMSLALSNVSAIVTTPTSGGTTKVVKVVSQQDIDKAKEQLADANKDDALKKLKAKFGNDDVIIESSLTTTGVDPVASPAVNQEATGKAKLTREVTYTLTGVAKGDMNEYLDKAFDELLTSKDSQRVYDNGLSTVNFSDFTAGNTGSTNDGATLTATAQIGPKINDNDIKEQAKGRRTGEVIGDIKAIDGVSDVNVKLSPFWVTGVPDDVKKISVEFKLKTDG
ncbi:MAG: hypothetical protein QG549_887 [Patescibacteria group bacterium]|nr:hypothetical protein [Patescibacteria group bacterium]